MVYITSRRNRNRKVTAERVFEFLLQFSEPRRIMITGHLLFMSDLIHYITQESQREDLPPKQSDVLLRAATIVTILAEDTFDNITEFYAVEDESSSPSLTGHELFLAGYRNGLEYYQESVNSILRRSTFKGKEKDMAKSFYMATGIELGEKLARHMVDDSLYHQLAEEALSPTPSQLA